MVFDFGLGGRIALETEGGRRATYISGFSYRRQRAGGCEVEDRGRAAAVEVSEAVALGGLDGEGEEGCAWVGRGRDEFEVVAEEGAAPALEDVISFGNARERVMMMEVGIASVERRRV